MTPQEEKTIKRWNDGLSGYSGIYHDEVRDATREALKRIEKSIRAAGME
jgi:hypothetical protein